MRARIPVILVVVLFALFIPREIQAAELQLTATQTVLVEWSHDGWGALGTVVLDLALGPRWSVTYIHDRGWWPAERYQQHDLSVTRVFAGDRTATLGWRVKVPEGGPGQGEVYGMWAFGWGDSK